VKKTGVAAADKFYGRIPRGLDCRDIRSDGLSQNRSL
jgi:hypothetical protein